MPFGAKASIGGCVFVFASPVSKVFMLHFVFGLEPQTESSIIWLMQDCDIFVVLCCSYLFMRGLAVLESDGSVFVPGPLEKPLPACTAAYCLC